MAANSSKAETTKLENFLILLTLKALHSYEVCLAVASPSLPPP